MIVYANLDQEARWARRTLPRAVLRRISAAATLLAALPDDPDEPIELYLPAPVTPDRLRMPATITTRVGAPPRWDLAWAAPDARDANDRRLALRVTEELGVALPGARVISSLAELDAHLAAGGAGGGSEGRWVCKAPWTAAGRDRAHGRGEGPIAGELRVHVGRLLERFGAVMFEPWMARTLDLGVCARLDAGGALAVERPHTLRSDARGAFLGIDVAEPALAAHERALLERAVVACGRALHALGYAGPFTVDAFVYEDGRERRLHPLCELNARHTFGHVARALARRLGTRELGFGAPPDGARLLVAPSDDDPLVAWAR